MTANYLRLAAALSLLAGVSHAQAYGSGVDGQSVFRVSETQVFGISSTSVRSAMIPSETRIVRIVCTTDCHTKVGNASVAATVSDTLLPALLPEYFKISENKASYISVIRDAADGKAYIDLMKP